MLQNKDYETLYPIVKGFVIKYECGGDETLFNEDVFHETGFKCLKLMRGKEKWLDSSFETIGRYFCRAYRINCLREQLYFRNQKEIFPITIDIKEEKVNTSICDMEIISNIIQKKFSKELEMVFKQHICNEIPISILEKESGIPNLKYQFSKIKEF